jgi:Cdc6-like AAA superfamily ATPase
VAGYLDRIGAGKILINAEPLSYDYVPEELVGRDEQLQQMAGIFQQINDHRISCRVAITGNVGCGKTVLSHVFSRDLQRHLGEERALKLVHVNCRNFPPNHRFYSVLSHILTLGTRSAVLVAARCCNQYASNCKEEMNTCY